MMKSTVHIPDDFVQAYLAEAMKGVVEKIQEVADGAHLLLKDQAILANEDVNGQQMPQKQPRPRGNPQNFPGLPLIQNDNPDEMANERWSTFRTGELEVTLSYDPSDHHGYLAEKKRDWLNTEQMNPTARQKIEEALTEALDR